jgi:uncharacterized protein (TIGR02453 family)
MVRFSPKALSFLRALKRNNKREWFKARKDQYDALLRAPMIEIIERLAIDLRSFAPDLVASPKVSLYRVYRDTRFSANKAPLKTHVAAVFPCRSLQKHRGAGLYFERSSNRPGFAARWAVSRVSSCSGCPAAFRRTIRPAST